jgi:hypothetical protein
VAKKQEWPDTWPGAAFFGIGACLGIALAVLGCAAAGLRLSISLPICCVFGIIVGFLGVVFREDVLLFFPPWN